MQSKRLNVRDRTMMEIELRHAAGFRAVATMAVLGLVTLIGIGSLGGGDDRSALGLHTESYDFSTPASVDVQYREAVAVAPASGVYEEPEIVVQYEVHA